MTYPFKVKKGRLHERLGLDPEKPIPLKTIREDLAKQKKKVQKKASHEEALEALREDQFAINAHYFRHPNRK